MEREKTEIERRFLVKRLPENLEQYPSTEILQGYLAVADDREVRIRRKGSGKYFMTLKIGKGQARKEREPEIAQTVFEELWPEILGQPLRRLVRDIPYQKRTINLDEFLDNLEGFYRAEVEFPTVEEAGKFIPPDWFGKEVTEDPRYNCRNIALYGIPTEDSVSTFLPSREVVDVQMFDILDIPTFDLDEGVQEAVKLIRRKLSKTRKSLLVFVAGGSASGKTDKVSVAIQKILGEELCEIRSLDNYYYGLTWMELKKSILPELTFDDPRALELDLARKHFLVAQNGDPVDEPIYDFETGFRTKTQRKYPKMVIIVEGLFALHKTLADIADIKIFVDVGMHGRLIRRLLRGVEREKWEPGKILEYFARVVNPAHEENIETTKTRADIIIRNEYDPNVEAQRSGLHEVQVKFETKLDPELLRKCGAEFVGGISQWDVYYNPVGIDLASRGEMIRVRHEGDKQYILTYKGPKTCSQLRRRPKFEFPIDEHTAGIFISMYGKKFVKIIKFRRLYLLDGIAIALDDVEKIIKGHRFHLGMFVELRSTDHEEKSEEKIISVAEKLGLDMKDAIRIPYVEF